LNLMMKKCYDSRGKMRKLWTLITGFLFLGLGSCFPMASKSDLSAPEPISFQERQIRGPLRDDSSKESLLLSVEKSLGYLSRGKPGGMHSGPGREEFSPENILRTLLLFRELLGSASDKAEIHRKIRENFQFWELSRGNTSGSILLTGYYEPILEGNLEGGGEYRYPLYRRPDDLVALPADGLSPGRVVRIEKGREVPYYSRREIDTEGALQGKGLEIVWLKDPWERFVLHIQGSGQVRLPDGRTLRVGYAGSNGLPYRSIGRYLIDQGFLDEKEMSMERVREFIQNNPSRVEEIFQYNERYIFFRLLPEGEGPLGALGIPLTPGRSIATDLTIFPPGALAFLVSRQPDLDESGRIKGWKILSRFVLNQDTGGAIEGPGRVDLFFGNGERARTAAGEMREEGKIYLLLAK
jgi:membrane-bound lytic murein transglycosylase A